MLRRSYRLLGSTNRYTDGSGRQLESNIIPRDLYLQHLSNRAYPLQGEYWQPVVAGKPSPHKGNIIISGGGVVGLTTAAQFALRGWHTTVVERCNALRRFTHNPLAAAVASETHEQKAEVDASYPMREKEFEQHSQLPSPYKGPLVRPHIGAEDSSPLYLPPFMELQYALLTRRALDVLEVAGVRLAALRRTGVKVVGVLDHPGAFNSWFTSNLTEHHPFAVNMLSVDMFELRRLLETHVEESIPNENLQVFHEHVIEAVYPLRQQVVVRSWSGSDAAKVQASADELYNGSGPQQQQQQRGLVSEAERTAHLIAQVGKQRHKNTSLTLSSFQWDKKFSNEAVEYDLLVSAEGVTSHLRDLLDVEGFYSDVDFGVRWFLLRCDGLSHEHIHRWLHRRRTAAVTTARSYHIRSPYQVPLSLAFPRIEASNLFAAMVYAPMGELAGLDDAEVLRRYFPDLAESMGDDTAAVELRSFTTNAAPSPTVFCEQLYNSVGLPSAVLVGDAAHSCNPFWMQSLSIALEDGAHLLNQVDAYSRHFYDAVKQFSDERGAGGDALRELTDVSLYYQRRKHVNPFLRFQNIYQRYMNIFFPRGWNTLYEGSVNHVYSRSIEEMLNSRGYTSYDYAEKQQSKHRLFYHLGRVYT